MQSRKGAKETYRNAIALCPLCGFAGKDLLGTRHFRAKLTQPKGDIKMNRTVVTFSLLLIMLGLCCLCMPERGVRAQANVVKTNQEIPLDVTQLVECTGEFVHFTGTFLLQDTIVTDGRGITHFQSHFNSQGVSGVGLTSGLTYQGTETVNFTTNNTVGPPPFEFTHIDPFHIISQNSADNVICQAVVHVTVNANGETTSELMHFGCNCRG